MENHYYTGCWRWTAGSLTAAADDYNEGIVDDFGAFYPGNADPVTVATKLIYGFSLSIAGESAHRLVQHAGCRFEIALLASDRRRKNLWIIQRAQIRSDTGREEMQ